MKRREEATRRGRLRARLGRRVLALYVIIVGCGGLPLSARAQDSLPHFALQSEADVITALGSSHGILRAFPRAQMVATEGRRVIRWLEEIAASETLAFGRRAAAMEALGLMRDSAAAAFLIGIIQSPGSDLTDPVATEAEADLAGNFDAGTCVFWRKRLQQLPVGEARGNPIAGLGYCEPADTLLIRRAEQGIRAGSIVHVMANMAVARLRRSPYNRRVQSPWGALPQSDGRYVPSADIRRRIIAWMCPNGCPVGPLPPNYVPPARERR